MKTKWRCNICDKTLSSKQIVESHIKKLHPSSDLSEKQYSRVVQVPSDGSQRTEKPKPVKKKTAYDSFAGLKNMFSNKSMCHSFSLWPSKRKSDHQNVELSEETTQVPESTTQAGETAIQTQETAIQTQETAIQTQDTAIQTQETAIQVQETTIQVQETTIQVQETITQVQDTVTQRHDIPSKVQKTFNNDQGTLSMHGQESSIQLQNNVEEVEKDDGADLRSENNVETDSEFTEQLSNFISDALNQPLPVMDFDIGGSSLIADLDVQDDFGLPSSTDVSNTHHREIRREFITPFKTRGHCGCEGCRREPCGTCYFCQYKKAK